MKFSAFVLCTLVGTVPVMAEVVSDSSEDFGRDDVSPSSATTVQDFSREDIRGFPVYVENSLNRDSPEEVSIFLDLLEANLARVSHLVKPEYLDILRQTTIWATDNNCRNTAAFYHLQRASAPWLERNGRPAEMAGGVEFCDVDYLVTGDVLSNYLVHELSHAFHDKSIPGGFANEHIIDAYDRQHSLLRYQHVLKADGDYDEAYANSNAIEYFAQLSTKYFVADSEYPFVEAELKHHDPWGWEIVDAAWNDGRFTSEWLGCSEIGNVRSRSGNLITLEFVNRTPDTRYVYWINRGGEVDDGFEWALGPGETSRIGTYRTHLWAIYDENNECVVLFKPGIGSEEVEITQ